LAYVDVIYVNSIEVENVRMSSRSVGWNSILGDLRWTLILLGGDIFVVKELRVGSFLSRLKIVERFDVWIVEMKLGCSQVKVCLEQS
jgi:hypothetical protein